MADRWDAGDAYDRFMGRWSGLVAVEFVRWLGQPPGASWLDVGCGTGALLSAINDKGSPRALAGIDPSAAFLATAAARLPPEADLRVGNADRIPFESDAFDAVVAGLVLNFVPDPLSAIREMRRVARPGGIVAAYVWDYADGMQFLRTFWDVAVELDPSAGDVDEGRRFPLTHAGELGRAFAEVGFAAPASRALVVRTAFTSFEDYWEPFLAGQGPAGSYVAGLDAAGRAALSSRLRSTVPREADGSIGLTACAWAVKATA